LTDFNQIWIFPTDFGKPPIQDVTKIRPVAAALIYVGRETDGHEDAKRRSLRLTRTLLRRGV